MPITLPDLKPAKGAVKKALRVGRGRASGAGKTSNRGHNGEGQRSGRSRKRGFEGGQMPGYRQMPKLGKFTMPGRLEWLEINVCDLDRLIPADVTVVDYDKLRELGLLKQTQAGVRLLGNGDTKRKLTIHVHHATPSAQDKIKAAGGTIQNVAVAS
jgi:large subunit ribosomal protein L15